MWGAVSGCAGCAVSVCWVCTCVTVAMAGWMHGVCVGACWVVSPQGGFSLSLFCNYGGPGSRAKVCQHTRRGPGTTLQTPDTGAVSKKIFMENAMGPLHDAVLRHHTAGPRTRRRCKRASMVGQSSLGGLFQPMALPEGSAAARICRIHETCSPL